MSDSTDHALSPDAPQSPRQALKALAEALETGVDVPDQARIREILGSFKASGLDRPTQEMIIEAREDAKAGRAPDALSLRMIAKALSSSARPKKAHRPTVMNEPNEPGNFAGASPTKGDVDKGLGKLREQADRAVEALTDREREVLAEHFKTAPWPDGNSAPPDLPPKKNGNGEAIRFTKSTAPEQEPPGVTEDMVAALYEETVRTDAELVALAADAIEAFSIPPYVELAADLYALAQKLEENPVPDLSAAPLLDRVEAEIRRRIEKAIKSPADLPAWVIEWAREERAKVTFRGLDLTEAES